MKSRFLRLLASLGVAVLWLGAIALFVCGFMYQPKITAGALLIVTFACVVFFLYKSVFNDKQD